MPYTIQGLDRAKRIAHEVQAIARDMARRGLDGKKDDPLPDGISSDAHTHIINNPLYFRGLVRMYQKELIQEEQNKKNVVWQTKRARLVYYEGYHYSLQFWSSYKCSWVPRQWADERDYFKQEDYE